MTDFRLCIATTTYKRPELTKAVQEWWASLNMPEVCGFVWAGDYEPDNFPKHEDDIGAFMDATGREWVYPFCPDSVPLGRKHNWALNHCRYTYHAVMVIGSDDIVQPELIINSVEAIKAGSWWARPTGLYFWEPATDRVAKAPGRCISGGGRVYSRKLLDMMDWTLWDDDINSKLDGNAETRIMEAGRAHKIWVGPDDVKGAVLSIKTEENLWPYDAAVNTTRATPVDKRILDTFEIERLSYRGIGQARLRDAGQ